MYLYNFVIWIERIKLIEVYYLLETSLKWRRIQQITSVLNTSPLLIMVKDDVDQSLMLYKKWHSDSFRLYLSSVK